MKARKATKKGGEIDQYLPAQDVLAFFKALNEARKEEAASRIELAKVRAAREIALTNIYAKHDLYRMVFDRLFKDRRDAIEKTFEIIDKGIASNDQDLILGALRGLSQIVAASPFSDLDMLAQALEGGGRIQI